MTASDVMSRYADHPLTLWNSPRWKAEMLEKPCASCDLSRERHLSSDVLALLAERDAEIARLREALDRCMIGGNHIASALIGALGPDFNEIPSFDAALERLWGTRADTDDMVYEAWMCWRAIMDARTTAGGPDWKDAALAARGGAS